MHQNVHMKAPPLWLYIFKHSLFTKMLIHGNTIWHCRPVQLPNYHLRVTKFKSKIVAQTWQKTTVSVTSVLKVLFCSRRWIQMSKIKLMSKLDMRERLDNLTVWRVGNTQTFTAVPVVIHCRHLKLTCSKFDFFFGLLRVEPNRNRILKPDVLWFKNPI